MDDCDDFKTYVAEYFSSEIPRHGERVFAELADAEEFLFCVYSEMTANISSAERRSRWAPVEV